MANILLLTDFSDAAAQAYAPVLDLARKLGCGVTLVHVVKDDMIVPGGHGSPLPGASISEETETARDRLRKLAAELGAESGVEVDFDFQVASNVVETIAAIANDGPFEMVAVATHGRTGWRHAVLGSVAEKLLHHCRKPVLCYPVRKA